MDVGVQLILFQDQGDPGQDVGSGFGAKNPAELVQEKIRVFLFWSSVHPNALKFIPNFDFGEEINLGPGSLKNSSFVKALISNSSDRSKTKKPQNWILL